MTFPIGKMSAGWRTGFGQVLIVQGAFDVLFPGVVLQNMDATLTFTPDAIQVRPALQGSCDILNGWTAPQP